VTTLVRLEQVAKRWPDGAGLAPVTTEVLAGELLVVRGRSGSGKSTLLAMLAGWVAPDHGTLTFHGVLSGADRTAWPRIAVVPQIIGPLEELTVAENVALPLRLAGVTPADADARVRAALDALDLDAEAGRGTDAVSLGQLQRMAVARAAIVRPALLLGDEPTCHQDPESARRVLVELQRVTALGGAVVVATHDDAVAAVADRVLELELLDSAATPSPA
jgi:putative ABC transport system ATP-binding protein